MSLNSGSPIFLRASTLLLVLLIRLGSGCVSQPIRGCTSYDTLSSAANCTCTACSDPFYILTANSAVNSYSCCQSSHVSSCLTCAGSDTFVCVQCFATYGLSPTNMCLSCTSMSNCVDCFYDNVCLLCAAGFTPQMGACVSCNTRMPFCASCSSSVGLCSTCVNSSFVVDSSTVPNICQPCGDVITGCLDCVNSTHCQQCEGTLYVLVGGRCDLCNVAMPFCMVCTGSSSSCSQCNSSDRGVANNSPSSCQLCSVIAGCLSCNVMSACAICNSTTYLNAGACSPCSGPLVGCSTCNGSANCTSCLNSTYLLNSTTNICNSCSSLLSDCLACSTQLRCTICRSSYAPYPPAPALRAVCRKCSQLILGCYLCSSYSTCTYCTLGNVISGGCSKVLGCLSVNISANDLQSNCLRCDSSSYNETPINGTCKCLMGVNMGAFCGQQTGCTKMALKNGSLACVACNYADNFFYNITSSACQCFNKYQLQGLECVEICGDGYLFDLPCDDGNIQGGDGCSSSCQLQPSYSCSGGSPVAPTHCIFKGKITISLSRIARVQETNSLLIYLDITPFTTLLTKSNISSFFNLTVTPLLNYSLSTAAFVNSQYVRSPKTTSRFRLTQSNGDPLEYDAYIWRNEGVEFAAVGLSISALVVSFVGSIGFGMIGVETLHTFQLAYILLANSKYFRRSYSSLQPLTKMLGLLPFTDRSSAIISSPFSNFRLATDFLDNFLLVGLAQIIGFLIYLVLKIYHKRERQRIRAEGRVKKLQEQNKLIQKQRPIEQFLYDFLLFFMFVGFQFHFQQVLAVQAYQQETPTPSSSVLFILILTFESSIVLFSQFVRKERQSLGRKDQIYVRLYITNTLIISWLSVLSLLNYLICLSFTIIILSFLQILSSLQLPYRQKFHNISICFNSIFILCLSVWLFLQNVFLSLSEFDPQIVYATLVCLFVVVVLAFLRSILVFRQIWQDYQKKKQIQMQAQQKEEEKFMEEHLMEKMCVSPIQLDQTSLTWKFQRPSNIKLPKIMRYVESMLVGGRKNALNEQIQALRNRILLHRQKFREGKE